MARRNVLPPQRSRIHVRCRCSFLQLLTNSSVNSLLDFAGGSIHDSTGLRLPGFLEIGLEEDAVTVTHQAWSGTGWKAVPMLENIRLAGLHEPASPT